MELEKSVTGIALRIDHGFGFGFGFEAQATPPELEPGDEDNTAEASPEQEEEQQLFRDIAASSPALEFLHLEGDPILELEDPNMDDGQVEDPSA